MSTPTAPAATVTLVNGTSKANPIYAVPADELNCYIKSMRYSVKPQAIPSLQAYNGIDCVDAYVSTEIDLAMSGELTTSNAAGAPSIALSTAFTPVNTLPYFGQSGVVPVFRLQSGEVNFDRGAFAGFDAAFKAKAGVN